MFIRLGVKLVAVTVFVLTSIVLYNALVVIVVGVLQLAPYPFAYPWTWIGPITSLISAALGIATYYAIMRLVRRIRRTHA